LLPGEAQRVLGEPNESTLLAYDIHLEEGFEPDRYVDIFDAGPVLTIVVDKSASASSSELRTVRDVATEAGAPHLVAAGGAHEYRCIVTGLGGTRADGAPLTAAAREALGVDEKDTVRCVPLHQASGEMQ
jgi:arginine N-succinyltransferase